MKIGHGVKSSLVSPRASVDVLIAGNLSALSYPILLVLDNHALADLLGINHAALQYLARPKENPLEDLIFLSLNPYDSTPQDFALHITKGDFHTVTMVVGR